MDMHAKVFYGLGDENSLDVIFKCLWHKANNRSVIAKKSFEVLTGHSIVKQKSKQTEIQESYFLL